MPIRAEMHNGTILEFPDDTDQTVINKAVKNYLAEVNKKELEPAKERTYGEAAKDIGGSLIKGLGSVAAIPSQVGTLLGYESGMPLQQTSEAMQKYGESLKSEALKQKEENRATLIQEAAKHGVLEELVTAFKETGKDPALFTSFLAEQLPMLIPGTAAGKAVKASLGIKAALAADVGVNAGLQGVDVGSDAYKEAYQYLIDKGVKPEEAKKQALTIARETAVGAGGISVLAQNLPGAKLLEKGLLGGGKKGVGRITGALGTAAGEGYSEAVEEGGGQFAKNLMMRQANPEQNLTQGVGEAAGMGLMGGVGLGGATGAITGGHGAHPQQNANTAFTQGLENVLQSVPSTVEQAPKEEQVSKFERKFNEEGNLIAPKVEPIINPVEEGIKNEPVVNNPPVGSSVEIPGRPIVQEPAGEPAANVPTGLGGVNNVVEEPKAGEGTKPDTLEQEPIAKAVVEPTPPTPIAEQTPAPAPKPAIVQRKSPVPKILIDPIERIEKSYIDRIEKDNPTPGKELNLNQQILRYVAGDLYTGTTKERNNAENLYKTLDDVDKAKVEYYRAIIQRQGKKGTEFWKANDKNARIQNEKDITGQDEDIAAIQKAETGASTDNLIKHAESGSATKSLREIADNKVSFTPLENLIARRFLSNNYLSIPKMQVIPREDMPVKQEDGTGVDGAYDSRNDTIYISQGQVDSHAILHEATHSFLHSLIRDFEAGKTDNKALKDLQEIYNHVLKVAPELSNRYGMQSLTEFSAEVMSNRVFQEELKAIPYKKSNLFTEFARVVGNLLGLANSDKSNVFVESLLSVDRAMNNGRKVQEEKTGKTFESPVALQAEQEPINPDAAYDVPKEHLPRSQSIVKKEIFSTPNMRKLITNIQDSRREAKVRHEKYDMAGKIIRDTSEGKENNFYDQLVASAARGKVAYNKFVEENYYKLNNAITELANKHNLDTKTVLNYLHQYLEAVHDPERRRVKYILNVPMKEEANARREEIVKLLNTEKMNKADAQGLRKELESIVNNPNNLDPLGKSIPGVFNKRPATREQQKEILDQNSSYYNVTGLEPSEAAAKVERFKKLLGEDNLKSVSDVLKTLTENTIEMNKTSNYWSRPVDNRANFYGWNNYVPLKGVNKPTETDELLDYGDDNREHLGTDLIKTEVGASGRTTKGFNPVLQILSDSVKAAMRAGRGKETTESIKNAILDGIIPGSVNKDNKGKPITFEEKDSSDILQRLTAGNKHILNYNEDGSVDILTIDSPKLLESIRGTYRETNPLFDIANRITSGLGKMHTRFNYNFAPLNFVRDALTNAFAIGADVGPIKAATFLGKLSSDIVTGGSMGKAFNAARLYAKPNGVEEIKKLAYESNNGKGDPIYKNMYDYIKQGGMVEYLQGMSIKSNFEELNKKIGKSGIITKIEDASKLLDIWNNMFELASRSSAYGLMVDHYKNTEKLSAEAAATKATTFVKNLANFEQVGKYGKELGAFYMFFRPSATGAVRAIDSVVPAFQSKQSAINDLPKNIVDDPVALAKWNKEFELKQKSSRVMMAALMGLGYVMFNMSRMMAPDDDLGRNKVLTDNMDQWNRFARFHFPGTDKVFQIPWGFGLGSFAAAGAQMAGAMAGNGSYGDALRNVFTQISLDSFMPIPISRMNIADDPNLWFVDSVAPNFMRPLIEFAVNKNGLGQAIYNDSQRRMGDAYLGGDNIPQVYKNIAEFLNESTLGSIDWSPNSLYFLSNSYADGPARMFLELPTSLYDIGQGKKDISSKTDIPFVGSFISTESSVDAREFAKYEKDIKDKAKIMKSYETRNPDMYDKYMDAHPFDDMLVKTYDHGLIQLNKLRKEANEIRNSGYSQKEMSEMLKDNKDEQNLYKNELLEQFKDYDN